MDHSTSTSGPGRPVAPSPVERSIAAATVSWRWRRQLLASLVLLARTSRRLRRNGYGPTRVWLDSRLAGIDPAGPRDDGRQTARDLAFVVRIAARFVPDATCLRQALVLRHLLAREHVPSLIRLGVRRPEGSELGFHAWVEVDGEVVSEPEGAVADYHILGDEPPADADL